MDIRIQSKWNLTEVTPSHILLRRHRFGFMRYQVGLSTMVSEFKLLASNGSGNVGLIEYFEVSILALCHYFEV